MHRDMDIVRRIALAVGELEPGHALTGLDDVNDETFAFHVELMIEGGLAKGSLDRYLSGDISICELTRLTWEGSDFLDSVRDDTLWNKAKANVLKPTASFTFGLLKDWVREELRQGFPTLRALP